jgi:hypothetical protein
MHRYQPFDALNTAAIPEATPPFWPSVRNSESADEPRSCLLTLPAELRIHIYNYVDLSPRSADFPSWAGIYFACRQIHDEIKNEIQPHTELERIKDLFTTDSAVERVAGAPGASWLQFGHLQNVIVHIELRYLPRCSGGGECTTLSQLYSLFLR